MKSIAPYLPFAIIAAAVVLAVYYFYYKPKKDATDAANAAAQQAYDASLTNYNPIGINLSSFGGVLVEKTANLKPISPSLLAQLKNVKIK